MAARTFRDLEMWKKAPQWVLEIYRLTKTFPREELFGLTAQLRRAAVSVPANIAEGFIRRTRPEKARFLNISQGSLEESRYYLMLAQDLNYGSTSRQISLVNEIGRMLQAYITTVQSRRPLTPDS